jgi:hypothetical protein
MIKRLHTTVGQIKRIDFIFRTGLEPSSTGFVIILIEFCRDVARTSRWQFENVYENTFGDIARIVREHSVVDVLLDTFRTMARGDSSAGGTRIQTSFNAMGLGVIGNILDNDTPFSVCVQCAFRPCVKDIARTDVTFTAHPIAFRKHIAIV